MNSNSYPFGIQWLDSSYQQTCLPNTPWQQVCFLFTWILYFKKSKF